MAVKAELVGKNGKVSHITIGDGTQTTEVNEALGLHPNGKLYVYPDPSRPLINMGVPTGELLQVIEIDGAVALKAVRKQ